MFLIYIQNEGKDNLNKIINIYIFLIIKYLFKNFTNNNSNYQN